MGRPTTLVEVDLKLRSVSLRKGRDSHQSHDPASGPLTTSNLTHTTLSGKPIFNHFTDGKLRLRKINLP